MGGRSHAHAFDHDRMIAGPAASSAIQVIWRTEDGIMLCYGTSAKTVLQAEPADTYAPGCLYIKVVAAGTSILFLNTGAAGAVAIFTDQK